MEKLYVKDRDIVVPGQIIAEGMSYIPSGKATRDGEKIYATSVGMVSNKGHVVKINPIFGQYMPKRGDRVIGLVEEIGKFNWKINIGISANAELDLRDASTSFIEVGNMDKFYKPGDYLFAGIVNMRNGYTKLSTKNRPFRKLSSGTLVKVNPTNVPRIIGREGSMIRTLKENSNCDVFVGQNGYVWIQGDDLDKVLLVQKAIKLIEKDASSKGLTEKVEKMLKGKTGGKKK